MKGHTKMKKAILLMAGMLALSVLAESFELFNGSIATNEFSNVKSSAGDHVTIVNSTLEVTNDFSTTDSTDVRQSMLYVGITNSTLTSLAGVLRFNAVRGSGNTTRVDVVGSTLNATNSFPGALKLGVWDPNAAWGERVVFKATNSTFNLSHLVSQGACNADFTKCTLVFDEHIPTSDGFGIGGENNMLAPIVTFRDCLVTNWTMRLGDRKGAAPTVVTFDGGTAYLRAVNYNTGFCTYTGDIIVTNGAKVLLTRSLAEQTSGSDYKFGNTGTTNRLDVVDGGAFGLNLASTATKRTIYVANGVGSFSEWNVVGGTFDNSASKVIDVIYLGYKGAATLNIGEGGTFKSYNMYLGGYVNNGATRLNQRINQTGGLYWACKSSEDHKNAFITLCHRGGHDCRYILDGGILKTPKICGGDGATVKGGTGYAVLSANGGTITPGHSDSTYVNLIYDLDLAECGPKGLTVDTADYPDGAKIFQEFTNKEGERGLFRKTGANTLNVGLPGRTAWDVATTRVDGGTLVFTNATANLDTTLVVADGGTFSMVGSSANLTLDALAVTNGVIALDPGDKITVPGAALFLGDFTITFSSALAADAEADVFLCEGEVSESNLRRIRDALAAAAVPEGSFCTAVAEVSAGVTHIRLKVAEKGSRLSDTTTWNGAADAWSTAGNWSDGVPTASTWAEFPSSAAAKRLTVPASSIAGSVRFTADGYTLSGGTLRVPGMRGAPVVANEAGTNTISAALTFDDIVEITNAPNTRLVLSGGIAGGSFEKTGKGSLVLAAANTLGGNVVLSGGKTVVGDAASFGADEGIATSVALNADAIEFADALGDDAVVDGRFTVGEANSTKAVIMQAQTNVTIATPTSVGGAFIKAGPGRLTMLVSGGEALVPSAVHAKATTYPNKYIKILEDGVSKDNADYAATTDAYFAGLNIYEGELLLKAAEGVSPPVVDASGYHATVGLHTDGASVTPALTLDGVTLDFGSKTFYANGYNLNNRNLDGGGTYDQVDSLMRNRVTLRNGASLRCGTYFSNAFGGSNAATKPVAAFTNSSVSASTKFWFAHNNSNVSASLNTNAVVTISAKDSAFASPNFTVDGNVAVDFDGCTISGASAADYAEFTLDSNAYGKMLLHGESVLRGTIAFSSKYKDSNSSYVFTLAFDDAEWQYGAGDYDLEYTAAAGERRDNFVIWMEGKGVVLKPASGTTFTTAIPFQGEGGMVVDGPGTVAFAADTVKFSGVAEVKQGTLDLSAAGTVSGIGVKGPGTVRGATLVNPTISLEVDDEWGVAGVPVFDGCAISGRVRVDCGRTEENPLAVPCGTPVVVARFSGSAPDVSGWRLLGSGVPGAHGVFSVQGDTVVMTVSKPGFTLIVR